MEMRIFWGVVGNLFPTTPDGHSLSIHIYVFKFVIEFTLSVEELKFSVLFIDNEPLRVADVGLRVNIFCCAC